MNPFSKLPYELFVHILSFLDHRQSFYQCLTCHPTLYTLFYDNEAFWRDLCINKHINYKHPAMTWRQFVLSGEMNRVCPHLTMGLFNQIRAKQDLVYLLSPAYSQQLKCHSICLHPGCDHIGNDQSERSHFDRTSHPVHFQISLAHPFIVCCETCGRSLGETETSEKWFVHAWVQAMVSTPLVDALPLTNPLLKLRRQVEVDLFSEPGWSYIIEKSWYDAWIQFLKGDRSFPPGRLNNKPLQNANDGSLLGNLQHGIDFELVSSRSRNYIERLYGVTGAILSEAVLPHDTCLARLLATFYDRPFKGQSIKL